MPGNIGAIPEEISHNMQAAVAAVVNPFLPPGTSHPRPSDFGPILAPGLALQNSIQDVMSALGGTDPDPVAAFNDRLNLPANITDAFPNGQFLD